jgi:hypothetical protein
MLNGNEILQVSSKVAMQDTGDELVVVLPDQGKYVILNTTGAKVAQLADGKKTLIEIAGEISESFGTDLDQVIADVLAFSEDLVSRSILTIVNI